MKNQNKLLVLVENQKKFKFVMNVEKKEKLVIQHIKNKQKSYSFKFVRIAKILNLSVVSIKNGIK